MVLTSLADPVRPSSITINLTLPMPGANLEAGIKVAIPNLNGAVSPETTFSGFTGPLTIALGPDFSDEDVTYTPRTDAGMPNFAKPFVEKVHSLNLAPQTSTSPRLCNSCSGIPIGELLRGKESKTYKISDTFSTVRKSAEWCELCALILPAIEEFDGNGVKEINVAISQSRLKIQVVAKNTDHVFLRLCADPDTKAETLGIKVGLPTLAEPGSKLHVLLLQEWLKSCDTNHSCYANSSVGDPELPTRVIYVGDSENQGELRLHKANGSHGRYIALSHRWGNGKPLTTTKTVASLYQRIEFDQLPKTFQDAVFITRELGIQYLWIDSLCIIQDDVSDWKREAARMGNVYGSAYCTIAANSARDSYDGFLKPRTVKKSLKFSGKDSDSPLHLYISELGDEDFNQDVVQQELNQRAWVLQERALSARTIHFASNYTYWECGSGIQCEGLSHVFRPWSLLGSSRFPEPLTGFPERHMGSCFEEIYTYYSRLSLTYQKDRPHAIKSLERRVADFYDTKSTFGIVHGVLHQSLLWQRSGNKRLKRINLSDDDLVPSWSWMAYEGEISYGFLSTGNLILSPDLQISSGDPLHSQGEIKCILDAPLLRITKGCSIEPTKDTTCKLRDANRHQVGRIRFDCQDEGNIERLRCIAIAWQDSSIEGNPLSGVADSTRCGETLISGGLHYVLVVIDTPPRRLGVGVIPGKYLSPFRGSEDEISTPATPQVQQPSPVEIYSKMRLLHTSTFTLQDFPDGEIPEYAILSHRWEEEGEVTLQDLRDSKEVDTGRFSKIKACCAQALSDGWDYIWVDCCCIDRSDDIELSWSINSMFRWYSLAQVCYVYLSDVPGGQTCEDHNAVDSAFRRSKWFTRSWTLQELIAPKNMVFFDQAWVEIGTKSSLRQLVSSVTGITRLTESEMECACIGEKMSWASKRDAKLEEDQAYSLMGIFGVKMPLHYGEGLTKAFRRLQVEILRISDDDSIFSWTNDGNERMIGALALYPAQFQHSGDIEQELLDKDRPPYLITDTNRTLFMEPLMKPYPGDSGIYVAFLNCKRRSDGKFFGHSVGSILGYTSRICRAKPIYEDRLVLEREIETGVLERRWVDYSL